jgi:hypothetical protein
MILGSKLWPVRGADRPPWPVTGIALFFIYLFFTKQEIPDSLLGIETGVRAGLPRNLDYIYGEEKIFFS